MWLVTLYSFLAATALVALGSLVEKFIDHIDWNEVAKRYKAVDRM